MLFSAVLVALLSTETRLVEQLRQTLLASAGLIYVAQAARGVLSQGSDVYSAFLMTILALLLSPAVAILMVFFGAPVIYVQLETILCSLVLSGLIVQPLLILYGLEAETWRQIISLELPLTNAYLGSIGGVIGAWLGVVPIALDWDRPWQMYPITIVLGAYAGCFLGNLVGIGYPKARVATEKKRRVRIIKPPKQHVL